MVGQLSDSLVEDITDFFLLDILKEEDRIELCHGAYLTTHRWLLQHLKFSGTPRQFIIHTLDTFIQYGTHLAEPLFGAMRSRYGDAAKVARHLAEFQAAAAGLVPVLRVGGHSAARHSEVPALYLVHSDADSALAQQIAKALEQHGRACRLGPSLQKGSDRWLADVGAALSQAYGVVCLVGHQMAQDRWVQVELLAAQDKRKPLVALQLPDTRLPSALPGSVPLFPLPASGLLPEALLNALPLQPGEPAMPTEAVSLSPALIVRAAELRYMDSLRLAELHYVGQYTQLGGQTRMARSRSDRLQLNPVVARTEFHHAPWRQEADQLETTPSQPFEDAVTELQAIRRAVLLGDPGSGKTTTLYKLAADLIDTALLDRSAPIPLLVRLGQWTEAAEPLPDFLQRSLGEIGEGLAERLAQGRAALLLDGINELPAGQQADKYRQVRFFLAQHPHLMAIVTCREQDYPPERELALDRVTVAPLDPVRIHEFVRNYLNHDETVCDGVDRGDDLFWKLAGEEAAETYERFNDAVGARLAEPFATFWLDNTLPDGLQWGWNGSNIYWEEWL
ncbi:MAG: NACHT domain-containing protein, partial [Candidatus Promineifilaceae bacterium]